MKSNSLALEVQNTILDVINRGNSVEVKREKENIVVVEIQRKVKIKSPVNGQA